MRIWLEVELNAEPADWDEGRICDVELRALDGTRLPSIKKQLSDADREEVIAQIYEGLSRKYAQEHGDHLGSVA